MRNVSDEGQASNGSGEPYIIVASDSHAGPSLREQLRPYCPREYLSAFDDFADSVDRQNAATRGAKPAPGTPPPDPHWVRAMENTARCAGLKDEAARIEDMDNSGIAADVIFAGGQNGEELPFVGVGFDPAERTDVDRELLQVGNHIWNAWLADFISPNPDRHVGTIQIPIWDVDESVREVRWGADHGLKAVNLPSPKPREFRPYYDESYDQLWATCVELGLPLVTHSGVGSGDYSPQDPYFGVLHAIESHWFSRRALPHLIFGGVFERYPTLKLVFTEQRVSWAPHAIADMDSAYLAVHFKSDTHHLPRKPSEYWRQNCVLSGSFLAPFETAMRHEVGLQNLMWGSDYPHWEGTWENDLLALRWALADVPESETRMILGDTAIEVYNLDRVTLRKVADRVGPKPSDIAVPVTPAEIPPFAGHVYRSVGSWA